MTTMGAVEDYDELRSLPAGKYDIVLIRQPKYSGYPAPLSSPTNGGIFVWDEYSQEAEDGGTIIVPNQPAGSRNRIGCWKRVFDDSISVKWFGAKGDMTGTEGHVKGTVSKVGIDYVLTSFEPVFNEHDKDKIVVLWDSYKETVIKPHITTIKSFKNTSAVVLLDPPITEMKGVSIAWGTDDTDAINKSIEVAKVKGFAVYIPPGHYVVTKTISYVTEFLTDRDEGIDKIHPSPYPVMKHGLRMFGAGVQVSFLHNLIQTPVVAGDYPSNRATIVIDGTGGTKRKSFQQTGFLKDFQISSTGHIDDTVGIDLMANWDYTIENVSIFNMGSHGIIIRNRWVEKGSSDYDQTDRLRLDNVFVFGNSGWGIIVDAVKDAISTSKIHIDRCRIEGNRSGGIQWTGQGGTIERSGIYYNGMNPASGKEVYGILVKNVEAIPNGLLITGCEIQDNANVQLMIAIGANIRIIQNDFKVDRIDPSLPFPSVDIQVGDGNLGYLTFNPEDPSRRIEESVMIDSVRTIIVPNEYVIQLTGTGISGTRIRVLSLPSAVPDNVALNWLVINSSDVMVTLKSDTGGDSVNITAGTRRVIYKDKSGVHVASPRTVNACVIQDNRIRANYDVTGNVKGPDHTVVKVNSNAVGTVIERWWISQFDVKNNPHWKLVDLVEKDPITDKRAGVFADGHIHTKTQLQRDGIFGGHVLLPFAFEDLEVNNKQVPTPPGQLSEFDRLKNANIIVGDIGDPKLTFVPHNSEWSGFLLKISGSIRELVIANPVARVVGTPLFFEFLNNTVKQGPDPEPTEDNFVTISFDDPKTSYDYDVGKGFKLYRGERVTGVMIFEGKWRLFTTWNCKGLPLKVLTPTPLPSSILI